MNAAHKILTVSYGTFSCTLEGFDDPFNTMKAIAEYFRDLAAEDRYFGAEPPQPDAAMLHKIAEREIQRRVEAKIQDNGVVLRARDAEAPPEAPALAPVLAPVEPVAETVAPVASAPEPEARLITASIGHSQIDKAPPPEAKPMPRMLAEDAASVAMASAAQRLQRLRAAQAAQVAAVSPVATAPVLDQTNTAHADLGDLAPAEVQAEPVAAFAPAEDIALIDRLTITEVAAEDLPPAPVTRPDDADVLAALRDTLSGAAFEPEALPAAEIAETALPLAAEPATPAAEPEEIDVLAALRETLAGAMAEPEALLAEAAAEPLADDLAATLDPQPEAARFDIHFLEDLPEDRAPEAEVEQTVLISKADADAEIAAALQAAAEAQAEEVLDLAETAPQETAAEVAEFEAEALAPIPAEPAFAEADFAEPNLPEAAAPEAAFEPAAPLTEEPMPSLVAQAEEAVAPLVAEKIQRARARVIKIRRLDPPAAPLAEAPAPTEAKAPEADAAALRQALTEAAPSRLPVTQNDEAAVERLIQKANTEFEEPQTKRRRSAIAHLKAAVLATVAERRAKGAPKPDDSLRQDPYRKDLDQVMRPASEKPAPLVLLPTLRIDQPAAAAPAPASVTPVRPRRVTQATALRPAFSPEEDELAAAEVANVFGAESAQSFQDFADGLGASNLQDLIEAAGAYLTLTKGQGGFTRPELFAQLTAAGSEPSREDGLRGFGRLLREGRLTRTDAGTYALTETSPMLAQAKRRAG